MAVSNASTTNGGNSFLNLQNSAGWATYGQGPPDFVDCSPSPCDGISYSMYQGIKSPSMSGESTQYNVGGTADYSDALFNNHLIGAFSSQGMPDSKHTLVPTYHNFTYDVISMELTSNSHRRLSSISTNSLKILVSFGVMSAALRVAMNGISGTTSISTGFRPGFRATRKAIRGTT